MSRIISHQGWIVLATAVLVSAGTTSLIAQRTLASTTPLAPTNVVVSGSKLGVTVTWTGVPTQAIYRVLRSVDLAKPGVDLTVPIATTSYLDRSAEPGASYYYQIIAVYADQTEGAATPALFAPMPSTATEPLGAAPTSGLMLPLQEEPALPSGTYTPEPTLVPLTRTTFCNPLQTLPGPAPVSFFGVNNASPTMGVMWLPVAGAVAYVVERSVDVANLAWTFVGSTCGGPSPIHTGVLTSAGAMVRIKDFSGGIVPGTKYVYKIKAIGAAGETGWNSTRWTAPVPRQYYWKAPTITGSTVILQWDEDSYQPYNSRSADRFLLSSEYGWSVTQSCYHSCKVTVYGVPEGVHTFTLTAQWRDPSSPFPDGVYSSMSRTMSLTIKP